MECLIHFTLVDLNLYVHSYVAEDNALDNTDQSYPVSSGCVSEVGRWGKVSGEIEGCLKPISLQTDLVDHCCDPAACTQEVEAGRRISQCLATFQL